MKVLEWIQKVLEEERRPMTGQEIADVAIKKGWKTKGKTPEYSIMSVLYVDIRDNSDSPFVKIDSKPRKFYLRKLVTDTELEKISVAEKEKVQPPKKHEYDERDLHPFLAYYAYTYLQALTKTIYHERSQKRNYTQWLHPDMVGVYFPIEEWREEILNLSKEMGSPSIKLYSFEVKRVVSFSNLRESFFQAVSNSSWANEAYLVVEELDQDPDFLQELKRLSTAFGIGVIGLDIEDPDSSETLLPAEEKPYLDWETMNKLANENSDFREFLDRVKKDFTGNEARKEMYDKVGDPEEITKNLKKKIKSGKHH